MLHVTGPDLLMRMVAAFLFDFCGTQLRVSRYFVLGIVLLLAAVCLQILIALPTVQLGQALCEEVELVNRSLVGW